MNIGVVFCRAMSLGMPALLALSWSSPALGSFHLFRIQEIYSSADGSVQFIELRESSGSDFENFWAGVTLTSTQGSTTRALTFPGNLPSTQTASRSVLIATPAFAALAGVAPDFVVPAPFLFPGGGTLNYGGVDSVTYPPMPSDGVSSVDRNGVAATNTPTNFAGQTGALVGTSPPPPFPPPAPPAEIPTLENASLAAIALLLAAVALLVRRIGAPKR